MFLTAPVQRWKVTLVSFLLVIGVGILLVVFASPSPIYESKAQILITQPVDPYEGGPPDTSSFQQIFPGMFIPNSMTLSTLASLASSNDLFDGIIKDLNLTDSVTGEPFAVERLGAMVSAVIQYDYGEGNNLPLLDLSVRGNNPNQVKDIADRWADAFIKEVDRFFNWLKEFQGMDVKRSWVIIYNKGQGADKHNHKEYKTTFSYDKKGANCCFMCNLSSFRLYN